MSEEFDPSAAAAAATGELADADPGDLEDAPDPDDATGEGPDATGGTPDDVGDSSSSSSTGVVATWLLPLLTASEAGPTAATLEEHGIGGWLSHVADGVIDYVLHFTDSLGEELDDSLGPLGKIGRGLYSRTDSTSATSSDDGSADASSDDDADGMPDIDGDVEGV